MQYQDHNGNWWMVCLGIRPRGYPYSHNLGRETFLVPVRWPDDGWPEAGMGGRVKLEMNGPLPEAVPLSATPLKENFNDQILPPYWNFLRNPDPGDWSLDEKPGALCLHGTKIGLSDIGSPALLCRRQEHWDFKASTSLEFGPRTEREEAGLCLRMNEHHHYEIAISRRSGKKCVFVRCRIGSLVKELCSYRVSSGPVLLRIEGTVSEYAFSFKGMKGQWKKMAKAETRYLSTETAGGFTGVTIGLYATGTGKACHSPAYFDWFDYEPGEA